VVVVGALPPGVAVVDAVAVDAVAVDAVDADEHRQ
jgi:hypothetical protein